MSKRKASQALGVTIDLSSSNPRDIASTLLSLLPEGATAQNNEAKKLVKAFTLIKVELDHRSNVLARAADEAGAEKPIVLGQVSIPEDVFVSILEFLPGYDLMRRVSLVCMAWSSAARMPRLWKKLDNTTGLLSGSNKIKFSMTSLFKVLARDQFSALKTLELPYKVKLGKKSIKDLAKHCPGLQELDIGHHPRVSSVHANDEQLLNLATHITNLTKIRFEMWRVSSFGIGQFAEAMGDRLLDLRVKGEWITGSYLSDSTMTDIGRLCPNLERFEYSQSDWYKGQENYDPLRGHGVVGLIQACPKLKHLALKNLPNMLLKTFNDMADNPSPLKHLHVRGVASLFGSDEATHVRSLLCAQIEITVFEDVPRG